MWVAQIALMEREAAPTDSFGCHIFHQRGPHDLLAHPDAVRRGFCQAVARDSVAVVRERRDKPA